MGSCKQEPDPVLESTIEHGQILVLNEGNFSWGNASIALYNPHSKVLSPAIFESVNNRPIGDVLQSAKLINGDIWLVINNSGKIEVIDTTSFKSVKTISGLRSPRYLSLLNGLVYVTDLYGDEISVFDATTFEAKNTFSAPGWSEQIATWDQMIYFINKDSNALMKMNPVNGALQKLTVRGIPFDLRMKNNEVVVGSYEGDSLVLKNISSGSEELYPKVLYNVPSGIFYSETNGHWYLKLGNDLGRLTASRGLERIYQLKTGSLYGVDLIGDEFYLSNAKDYVQNSEMIRIDFEGKVLDQLESGRITNGFLSLE